MEGGEDLTPFWIQNTTRRRRVASAFFGSGLVVVLLLITAVFFFVFVVPSALSISSQIFRPISIKRSWDSLNVVLVLVAVVFGFLSRNKNEDYNNHRYSSSGYDEFQETDPNKRIEEDKPNASSLNRWYNYEQERSNLAGLNSNQWYEYSEYHEPRLEHKGTVLRKNSSSYPDLREFSNVSRHWGYGDCYGKGFYDDIHVDRGRVADPGQQLHRRHRSLEQVDLVRAPMGISNKTVIVDTLVTKSKKGTNFPPAEPAAVAAPVIEEEPTNEEIKTIDPVSAAEQLPAESATVVVQPVAAAEEIPRRVQESVARRKERSSRRIYKDMETMDPVATPPPPPPPPQKSSKSDRKRGGSTGNSTKDFLNSLYHKKKRKQRQKSTDNMDPLLNAAQPPLTFQLPPSSPPPPPPPPPPPSVFHNLFSSKKQKRKRTITVTVAPPSPPPPPPRRVAARELKLSSHYPPKSVRIEKLEENSNSGGESPLNRIPPPPPPPPASFLKTPAWKFVVQGDYVRINSIGSSRSGSPDPEEIDSDVATPDATSFHPSPLFFPSPDVNTKAESFITNFRAKLKLEKIHSMKKREVGLSTLGPGPGPSRT